MQFRRNRQPLQRTVGRDDPLQQAFGGKLPEPARILRHAGQGRMNELRQVDIIETHHRQRLRHRDAQFCRGTQGADA